MGGRLSYSNESEQNHALYNNTLSSKATDSDEQRSVAAHMYLWCVHAPRAHTPM